MRFHIHMIRLHQHMKHTWRKEPTLAIQKKQFDRIILRADIHRKWNTFLSYSTSSSHFTGMLSIQKNFFSWILSKDFAVQNIPRTFFFWDRCQGYIGTKNCSRIVSLEKKNQACTNIVAGTFFTGMYPWKVKILEQWEQKKPRIPSRKKFFFCKNTYPGKDAGSGAYSRMHYWRHLSFFFVFFLYNY